MRFLLPIVLASVMAIVRTERAAAEPVAEQSVVTIATRSDKGVGNAEAPSGEAILRRIDANMTSESRIITSRMIIHGRRESRAVASRSWARGEDTAFTEYLAPARERGTKMLKLGDQLWMYSPGTDRTIQLSGHMLRQSVMGSDLSYEDMMDDPHLANLYTAIVTGTDTVEQRACWVLQLTAREKDVAYHSRKLWVDRERTVPVREELYAKGGKLLKRIELTDFESMDDRWYPMHMVFKDMLKKGAGTEFVVEEILFDVPIPEHILTKAALRR